MPAIKIDNLTKIFSNNKRAVDSLNLTLEPGEIFGFLGPNGAGKTTTVKVLTGVQSPSKGNCQVLGLDPATQPQKVHALSGVVTEHAQMYDNLTGWENLLFYGSVFGLSRQAGEERALELLGQLNLEDAKDQKLAAYSTGMRQRLSLARALMHRPPILFLDEPTSGLDPESAQNVNQLIAILAREQGVTVFLCTHQLRYAQELCTSFGLIGQGKLLASGTLAQLRTRVTPGLQVQIKASKPPVGLAYQKIGEQEYTMSVASEEEIPPLVRRFVAAGCDIYQVSAELPTLEEIYFALTARTKEVKHE